METWKCTMLIELTTNVSSPAATNHRTGGWSESFYDQPSNTARVVTDFETLCGLRAALLPIGAAIVGQRYQRIDSAAPSQSNSKTYPGASTLKCDQPSSALYCRLKSVGKNFRPTYIRGLPDDVIKEGEYIGSGDWHNSLKEYGQQLDGYYFRGKNLSNPKIPIDTIDGTKLLTTVGNHGLAVGNTVKVVGTEDTEGVKHTATYIVKDVPTLTTAHLVMRTTFASTGGTVQNVTVGYQRIGTDALVPGRVVTKKVGRPFTQYVGRHAKR